MLREAYEKAGLPADVLILVDDTSRESAREFMRLRGVIDCLIPRGGPSLIEAILEHATVPYVIDGDGNCHVYVDAAADLDMAAAIVVNAKTQRPSVCNAAESLIVHQDVAERFLAPVAPLFDGVELRGDDEIRILGSDRVQIATDEDYGREFLDLTLSVRVVDDLDGAIDHIRRFGSGHTEAIVTDRSGHRFALSAGGRRRRRGGQRVDPVHRRRGVRLRGRDRHQHPEASRAGADGPSRVDDHQVLSQRNWSDQRLTSDPTSRRADQTRASWQPLTLNLSMRRSPSGPGRRRDPIEELLDQFCRPMSDELQRWINDSVDGQLRINRRGRRTRRKRCQHQTYHDTNHPIVGHLGEDRFEGGLPTLPAAQYDGCGRLTGQ